MPYNPTTDLVGLWRNASGGVEKAEMPGLDFVVSAMARAGLLTLVTSQTAPTTNQSTTAWLRPANPSFNSEGQLFMWDPSLSMYVPATPELFHGGSGGGGGDGGGGDADMAIISGTAPSNPVNGQQWWNGSIMQVWDGGAWQVVGGGTSTLVFAITQTSSMAIANTTGWNIAPLVDAPQVNTVPGSWDPTTHKYTAKKPGYYAFSVRAYINNIGAGLAILKNDDGIFDTSSDLVVAIVYGSGSGFVSLAGFVNMNGTTDYIRYFVSSTVSPVTGIGGGPVFSILELP